jgi:hypothetical protein
MNSLKIVLLLLLGVLLPGCRNYYKAPAHRADYYYLNREKDPAAIGRVAIIELDNYSSYPQIARDVTEALFQALQKKQVFGLTTIHQQEPAWRSLQTKPDSTYTLDQLAAMRRTLKCSAIMTGTITQYQPYPHMVIGLRLKLLDLTDGQLVWALEQVWDSGDKATEYRIKDYFEHQKRSGFAPLREQLAVISPLEFIKFATYEVAETL